MKNRIIFVKDGRVYYCADCPYRNRETGFCGFCMKKILDDIKELKTKKVEESTDGIQTDSL